MSKPRLKAREVKIFRREKKNIIIFYIDHKYTTSEKKYPESQLQFILFLDELIDGFSNCPPRQTISS